MWERDGLIESTWRALYAQKKLFFLGVQVKLAWELYGYCSLEGNCQERLKKLVYIVLVSLPKAKGAVLLDSKQTEDDGVFRCCGDFL